MRTLAKAAIGLLSVAVFLLTALGQPGDAPPAMKFNDVREVAPGVFFRYSAISATRSSPSTCGTPTSSASPTPSSAATRGSYRPG